MSTPGYPVRPFTSLHCRIRVRFTMCLKFQHSCRSLLAGTRRRRSPRRDRTLRSELPRSDPICSELIRSCATLATNRQCLVGSCNNSIVALASLDSCKSSLGSTARCKMRPIATAGLAIVCVWSPSVHGQTGVQDCLELIRLSRSMSQTVMSQSQFADTLTRFCNEYQSARSQRRSLNLDLSVLGLGSGGTSSNRANALGTKYCSEGKAKLGNESDYQQYLEAIDPGAYNAFEACLAARNNGVQFEILTPITRDLLEIIVFHETNVSSDYAELTWSGSKTVSCLWEALDGTVDSSPRRRLLANERTRLRCSRSSHSSDPIRESDHVSVIRDGGNAKINVPWPKYNREDLPIPTLAEIRRNLEQDLANASTELARVRERIDGLVNRKWHNLTETRREDQCYSNNTDYPIEIAVSSGPAGDYNFCRLDLFVDGEKVLTQIDNNENWTKYCAVTATVPPNASYHVDDDGSKNGSVVSWWELRGPGGEAGAARLSDEPCPERGE